MASPKLYVYFDITTGSVLAFSNELRTEYEHKLAVTKEQYHLFVSGIEKFADWVVCRTKNIDYEFELVQREKQHILFKNNLLEKITNNTADSASELTIHWDAFKKVWVFIITDNFLIKKIFLVSFENNMLHIFNFSFTNNLRYNYVD